MKGFLVTCSLVPVLVASLLGRIDAAEPTLVAQQPVKRLRLQSKEVRNLERFLDTSE